jgi:hypothetical protein
MIKGVVIGGVAMVVLAAGRELEFYSLNSDYAFVPEMKQAWAIEKPRVLQSAQRNK